MVHGECTPLGIGHGGSTPPTPRWGGEAPQSQSCGMHPPDPRRWSPQGNGGGTHRPPETKPPWHRAGGGGMKQVGTGRGGAPNRCKGGAPSPAKPRKAPSPQDQSRHRGGGGASTDPLRSPPRPPLTSEGPWRERGGRHPPAPGGSRSLAAFLAAPHRSAPGPGSGGGGPDGRRGAPERGGPTGRAATEPRTGRCR